jgi:hypothetical protein
MIPSPLRPCCGYNPMRQAVKPDRRLSVARRSQQRPVHLLLDWQNQPNQKNPSRCPTHVCSIKNRYLVTSQTTMLITSMVVLCVMVWVSTASAAIYKARRNIHSVVRYWRCVRLFRIKPRLVKRGIWIPASEFIFLITFTV